MTTIADKARLLKDSGLFDEAWYLARYPDVRRCGMLPCEHYVRIGQHIGRAPSAHHQALSASQFIAACRSVDIDNLEIGAELRERVAALRLFDSAWYRTHFAPELSDDQDALADYLSRSARDPRIDPGPIFSTRHYVERNPDTSGMAPLIHACMYGFHEGRPIFDPHKVNTFLVDARSSSGAPLEALLDASTPVEILFWKDGNFFFEEIAKYLCVYLINRGFDAACSHVLPQTGAVNSNVVVVAPHEFCAHGPGKAWDDEQLAQPVYLNTEQWHTGWFSLAYKFLVLSNKAIDMNPASAAGLQRLGIQTAFLPILPLAGTPFSVGKRAISESFAAARYIRKLTYPETFVERPYDVLFIGASNARREAALAGLAGVLADYETFIHCPRFNGPVRAGDQDMISTADLVQLARNSKILLNIHQGESRYFEWHRLFLFGIMEGCVVLTEPSIPNTFVQAGRHYLECELKEMPEKMRWLLESREGQAEMARIRDNCDQLRLKAALFQETSA